MQFRRERERCPAGFANLHLVLIPEALLFSVLSVYTQMTKNNDHCFVWAAITKCHRQGGFLKKEKFISCSFGGWESENEEPAWSGYGESSLLVADC